MEAKTQVAEHAISDLSSKCHPADIAEPKPASSTLRTTWAHLSLLGRCLSATRSLLKQGDILQSSKLLVISRLLHRALASQTGSLKYLQTAQNRITATRRQILTQVDDGLARPNASQQSLVRLGCAFCLVTSSSSSDVLVHFQDLRLQYLQSTTQEGSLGHDEMAKVLRYYIKSVKASSTFSSHHFNDALRLIQSQPILRGDKLTMIPALAMDSFTKLIAPEIIDFVPYIKRNDVSQEQIRGDAEVWSENMFSVFLDGLRKTTHTCADIGELFRLREKLFSAWLPTCFSIKSNANVLGGMREQLNSSIISQLETQAKALQTIDVSIMHCLDTSTETENLWSPDFVGRRLRKEGDPFMLQLRSRHLGIREAVWNSIQQLQGWCSSVEKCQAMIDDSQKVRWKDKIEDVEEEEEREATTIVDVLGKADPQTFHLAFEAQLKRSKVLLEEHLVECMRDLQDIQKITVLIRVVRECDQRISIIFSGPGFEQTKELISQLQLKMASAVVKDLLQDAHNHQSDQPSRAKSTLPSDIPSPRAFRTLMQLCKIMTKFGGHDVWTRPAVDQAKTTVWEAITASERTELFMQTDFDRHYLEAALQPPQQASAGKRDLANGIDACAAKAEEYWKRNKLLFGVLA